MTTPGEPQLFIRPYATNQTLEFFWQPPVSDGGSPITSYIITDGATSNIITGSGYYKITGLTNGQPYSYSLAASNTNGLGPYAQFRSVQPGLKPDAPSTPSFSNVRGQNYSISWSNPSYTGDASLLGTCLTAIPVDSNDNLITSDPSLYIKKSVFGTTTNTLDLNSNYNWKVLIQSVNDPGYSQPICFTSTILGAGAPSGSGTSLLSYARDLNTQYSTNVSPTSGGALTINSLSVGNHDYCVINGNTILSSFTASNYFTNTEDTASAWIVVKGNLTINNGITFIPPVRKLFTVLYVTGNLVCNGTISMTARGANHSGTGNSGGATTAVNIRIGTGTFSAVSNPQIPATGGAGAVARTTNGSNPGSAGTNGGSGGGGTGERFSSGTAGAGAAGTCFSGGSASGGSYNGSSATATANGGAGSDGGGILVTGGTGNPGGAGAGGGGTGNTGTGGTLIVIVAGTISGTGSIQANGVAGARIPDGTPGGGGSGGGSVTVLFGTDSSSITPTATGGPGNASGNGGDGTARKLAIGVN